MRLSFLRFAPIIIVSVLCNYGCATDEAKPNKVGQASQALIDEGGGCGGGGGFEDADDWVDSCGGGDTGDIGDVGSTYSIQGFNCRAACWAAYSAGCYVVSTACAVGSTITLGGATIPCVYAVLAACALAGGGASVCSDSCPP